MNNQYYKIIFLAVFCFAASSLNAASTVPNLPKTNAATTNAIVATNAAVTNNQPPLPTHFHPVDLKSTFTRILQFKIIRDDNEKSEAVLPASQSIARTLSSLQPTLVSGLLHISENSPLRPAQVEMFTTVRKEVMAANPHCKFDVVINASKYSTAAEMINKVQEINVKIIPDLIIFRLPSNNEMVYPAALTKTMEFAHAHGQMVGYEGPTAMIPDAADFIIVHAKNLEVRREDISALRSRHHLPILIKIPADIQQHEHQVGEAPKELSVSERTKLLMHLAENQSPFGYHVIYPITSPSQQDHPLEMTTDNALLVTMKALMARYN